ncbi:hypothetical protein EDD11_000040 [Mortierella claussenii]|nr:hypothetical protein EDD11_000040 [Mortierella claussenii]
MSSRYHNTAVASGLQQQQQRYVTISQFQEGHPPPTESLEWNPYNEQAMKPATSSVSSFKSWASSADPTTYTSSSTPASAAGATTIATPSPYTQGSFHAGISQQALQAAALVGPPPPRGSSASYSAARNRSNSNASNLSAAMGYGHNYSGSHMSHVSQLSNNSSSYAHPPPSTAQHSLHHQQQQPWQQNQQYPASHEITDPSMSTNGYAPHSQTQGYQHNNSYNASGSSAGSEVDYHQHQHLPYQQTHHEQQQQYQQHRSISSDVSFPSVNRTFQQEALTSQSLLQTMDQQMNSMSPSYSPNGSPRATPRSAPMKRREPATPPASGLLSTATTAHAEMNFPPPPSDERYNVAGGGVVGDLPSLDQYEEMLQKMTASGLGSGNSNNTREPRMNQRRIENDRESRSERVARQARKQQRQQQQLYSETMPQPQQSLSPEATHQQKQTAVSGGLLQVSAEERKLRRRSSLPTSFGIEAPSRLLTDLKRRSSGLQRSPKDTASAQVHTLADEPLHEEPTIYGHSSTARHSWEDESVAPRNDLLYDNQTSAIKTMLQLEDNQDTRSMLTMHSVSEESEKQQLEQQRKNKRDSGRLSLLGSKPPLTTKSQLRLSHTLSQSDVDEVATLSVAGPLENNGSITNGNNAGATREQHQRHQRNESSSPKVQHHSDPKAPPSPPSIRPRAVSPLDVVSEEGSPIPSGPPPTRQQLLTTTDDGPGAILSPANSHNSTNRSVTPTSSSSRSRPTTPVSSNIRPPPGPAPMPTLSAPIVNSHGNPNNNGNQSSSMPRKNSPAGRRVKPSPPVSTSILPPTTPRPRAGSIASLSGMNTIAMGSALHQAPPSLPLPSLPPPPASAPLPTIPPAQPGDPATAAMAHRRRKASGSKELVIPTPQLLGETGMTNISQQLEMEKEISDAKVEMDRLRSQLQQLEQQAVKDQTVREELELKVSALQNTAVAHSEHAQEQKQGLDDATSSTTGNTLALHREIQTLTSRLQQEEAQYRTLQDTVQRLTSKLSGLESQHTLELHNLQRDHEEVMEKVVIDHANALTDLSEQQLQHQQQLLSSVNNGSDHHNVPTSESENRRVSWQRERLEFFARERVLNTRVQEQTQRNDALETTIFEKEMIIEQLLEEKRSWKQSLDSMERQLKMEQLQQQENHYRKEQTERENRRLRAILADLDLATLLSQSKAVDKDSEDDDDVSSIKDLETQKTSRALFEAQQKKWMEQVQLLERKMAKAEEAAADIMQKNMELMVALDMAQSR